jgi:hypothetical protein
MRPQKYIINSSKYSPPWWPLAMEASLPETLTQNIGPAFDLGHVYFSILLGGREEAVPVPQL